MPYTEQNQPYKKSEPLTSGPCGNHEIFTLRRNEGDSFKFNPTGHDIFILKGDGDNGRVTYVINAGRYYIQQDDKVIEIGRFGDDRENQAVTVGQGYGKICTVESFCRMELSLFVAWNLLVAVYVIRLGRSMLAESIRWTGG